MGFFSSFFGVLLSASQCYLGFKFQKLFPSFKYSCERERVNDVMKNKMASGKVADADVSSSSTNQTSMMGR